MGKEMTIPVDVYEDIKTLDKDLIERSVRFLPEPKRTEELMKIVDWFIDNGNPTRAVDFAMMLKLGAERSERLEAIIAELVKQGSYDDAEKVANTCLCRSLSIEELITMFKLHVANKTITAKQLAEEIIKFYEKENA